MGLFDKAKSGITTGVKVIGKGVKTAVKTVGDVVTTIKDDVVETKAEKELRAKLVQQFNSSAHKFTMVLPGEELKLIEIYAQVNFTVKTLTLFEEVENLTSQAYFIDEENRKFEIRIIRLNQSMDIMMDNIVYPSSVSVIEYNLIDDDETKQQMQSIIDNNGKDVAADNSSNG